MKFTVGGQSFELTREQVIAEMKGAEVEPIQKHVVEIDGREFPPKQVFATVTRRARQTFTTMEAQRVLTRLGFVCRSTDRRATEALVHGTGANLEARLAGVEAAIGTIQAGIAGLHARVNQLESAR